jgi:hypothetical protein
MEIDGPTPSRTRAWSRTLGAAKGFGAVLMAVLLFGAAGPAMAGDPTIDLAIAQSPASVPVASNLFSGGVGYVVTFTNKSKNTVSKATLTVTNNSTLAPQDLVGCVADCQQIGEATFFWPQLQAGESRSVTVIYQVPSSTGLEVKASLNISTASKPSSPSAQLTVEKTITASFGPIDDDVAGYVLKGGGKLTAQRVKNGVTKFSSTVLVPSVAASFLASVDQFLDSGSCSATYLPNECQNVKVTVPGQYSTDAPLVMVFVRDASTLAKNAKIRNVVIYHSDDDTAANAVPLQPCDGTSIPSGVELCVISEDFTFVQGGVLQGFWRHTVNGLHNGLLLFR